MPTLSLEEIEGATQDVLDDQPRQLILFCDLYERSYEEILDDIKDCMDLTRRQAYFFSLSSWNN